MSTIRKVTGLMLALSTAPMTCAAQTQIGDAANAWFTLQASHAESAPAQPMLGAEASRAYERYLKSFETSIPAHYGSSLEDAGRPALDVNYHDSN